MIATVGTTSRATDATWISPVAASAVGETNWGGTWYTGPAAFAIDTSLLTSWTYSGLGSITFDMGSNLLISGITAYWGGSVTNGNTVGISVDSTNVLNQQQFGAYYNTRTFSPVAGRYIKYTTLPLPHNEFRQIATWSEIADFKVLAQPIPEPTTFATLTLGITLILAYAKRRSRLKDNSAV